MCSSGRPSSSREFLELAGFDQLQVVGDDLPGHPAARVRGFRAAAAGTRAGRARPRRRDRASAPPAAPPPAPASLLAARGDLVERRRQVPVLVQVADDRLGGVADRVRTAPGRSSWERRWSAERDRRREKRLEGRLLDGFRGRALVAGVEVVVEERAEIDLVERVGGRLVFDRFRALQVGDDLPGGVRRFRFGRIFGLGRGLADGLENPLIRGAGSAGSRSASSTACTSSGVSSSAPSSTASSRTGFWAISWVIMSFSSRRLS